MWTRIEKGRKGEWEWEMKWRKGDKKRMGDHLNFIIFEANQPNMKIEVSNGEIIDKLTIVQIKLERIRDEVKLKNLKNEFDILSEAATGILKRNDPLYQALYQVNCDLWDIEDKIRDLERNKEFNSEFIETARAVYFMNDKRSEIKREINIRTSSGLIEEKSYEKY
ncbi:MAG: DUF6165 family protein [Chloroflexota bacterium]